MIRRTPAVSFSPLPEQGKGLHGVGIQWNGAVPGYCL
jgi:hypothetical protein